MIDNPLFEAAATTLQTFGRDPKHLGGEIGITAIPHTWGQNLGQHIIPRTVLRYSYTLGSSPSGTPLKASM